MKILLTRMLLRHLIYVISISGLVFGEQVALNLPLSKDDQAPLPAKVGIIGAGIAGTSAAYHLCDQYGHAGFEITIYEANSQVGGRIKSAKVYDGAYGQQVETGARSFYADDECIQSLIDETGLRRKLEPHYPVKKSVGVWMGQASFSEAKAISKGGRGLIGLALLGDTDFRSITCANGSPKNFHHSRDCLEGGNTQILICLRT